jgi:heme-degrading monooxygenase HmoA
MMERSECMIVRMIVAKVAPDQEEAARRVWKDHCAPLMIGVTGCVSEQLLASTDEPGEIISMATWESKEAIDAYRRGPEHEEIQKRTRELLSGARATVKTYDVVP